MKRITLVVGALTLSACTGKFIAPEAHKSTGIGSVEGLNKEGNPQTTGCQVVNQANELLVAPYEPLAKSGNPTSPYVVLGKRYQVDYQPGCYKEEGIASWYGPNFNGKRASSGEIYDMNRVSAAHKTLPLPSYVLVTNLENNKQLVIRVNDRGPYHQGRIIDLSKEAARQLGVLANGTAKVKVELIPMDEPKDRAFYVQAGAFGTKANADKQGRLLGKKFNVKYKLFKENGLYKVWLGPSTKNAAKSLSLQVAKATTTRVFVVEYNG